MVNSDHRTKILTFETGRFLPREQVSPYSRYPNFLGEKSGKPLQTRYQSDFCAVMPTEFFHYIESGASGVFLRHQQFDYLSDCNIALENVGLIWQVRFSRIMLSYFLRCFLQTVEINFFVGDYQYSRFCFRVCFNPCRK